MKVEDRIFKRAAEAMQKYKGVEVKDAAEMTFQPQINPRSLVLAKKRQGDEPVFDKLYNAGIEKVM